MRIRKVVHKKKVNDKSKYEIERERMRKESP